MSRTLKSIFVSVFVCSVACGVEKTTEVEWRGMLDLGSSRSFSLYFPESKQSIWLEVGESRQGIRLVAFKPETRELHVMAGSHPQVLKLRAADGTPLTVITDAVVARRAREETTRVQSPTTNPRMRKVVMSRRAAGMEIPPPSAFTTTANDVPASFSGSASRINGGNEAILEAAAETSQRVVYNDPNPRIFTNNDLDAKGK